MSDRTKAGAHIHIDEPQVRVTEYRFAPGAETGWHRHEADYVVVPLVDGDLLLEEPGGSTRTAKLTRHVPYAREEGVEHNVVNANAYEFAFIEVEHLKDGERGRRQMLYRFTAAWNAHDLESVMACFVEDCQFWSSSGPLPEGGVFKGKAAVAGACESIFQTFPDAKWTDSRVTLFGSRVLWEWTFVGTAAATGVRTQVLGMDLLDLEGDRIHRKNSFRKSVSIP